MSPALILAIVLAYIGLLYLVSVFSSRGADADTFYTAGRRAPWYLVSYGMIGVSISGITFVSVPGEVARSGFAYFQLVIGYALGLLLVALLLIPLFYRWRLVSIYTYLEDRFGRHTHRTGAGLFLIAHLLGAAFRLYLMAYVLQYLVFDRLGIPFALTVLGTLLLIWLYTYKGGIQTVLFTDVLQTTFLLLAAVVGIGAVAGQLEFSIIELQREVWSQPYARIWHGAWDSPDNAVKLILTGLFLTFTNNGLDQAIMQKHLTVARRWDAQKNLIVLSLILLLVNLLFLSLGGSLVYFAQVRDLALPAESDQLYPLLATRYLGPGAGIAFIIGIAAAAYSSADTSLTGLTTAFCVDFLGYQSHRADKPGVRRGVHLGFSLLLFLLIMGFRALNNDSVISAFIKVSGYAYGPLLALFAFGTLSRGRIRDRWVPWLCLAAPGLALALDAKVFTWFGYDLNYETILVSALLTLLGLFALQLSGKK